MAINDVNNDKLDDLITSNTEGNILTVYYFNEENYDYSKTAQITLPPDNYARGVYINRNNNELLGVFLYCLDDSVPDQP